MELNEKILNDENLEEVQGRNPDPLSSLKAVISGALAEVQLHSRRSLPLKQHPQCRQIEVGQKVVIKY